MNDKKAVYLGVFFLAIELVALLRNAYIDLSFFFWFCDMIPLAFAFAFFTKNEQYIKGIVSIGLIPQIIWLLLFMPRIILRIDLFPEYSPPNTLFFIISSTLLHLTTIFALLATYQIRPQKSALKYALYTLIGIYVITLLFTSPQKEVNYIYSGALPFTGIKIPYQTMFWIPLVFLLLVLPTHLIQKEIYKRSQEFSLKR